MVEGPYRFEEETVDLVVVGGGPAGLWATYRAAAQGLSVALLEREAAAGGLARLAIGSVTASETPWQEAAGVTDRHADHLEDWYRAARAWGGEEPRFADLARIMIALGPAVLDRVAALGLHLSGPHPEPAVHRRPRLLNVVPDFGALVDVLVRRLAEAPAGRVRLATGVTAEHLVVGDDGSVEGVLARRDDGAAAFWPARRAVLLAAGPVRTVSALIRVPAGGEAAAAAPVLGRTAGGIGHLLGLAAGGRLVGRRHPPDLSLRRTEPPHVEPYPALALAAAWVDEDGGVRPPAPDMAALRGAVADARGGLYAVWGKALAQRLYARREGGDVVGRDGWLRAGKFPLATAPGVGYAYLEDGPALGRWIEAASTAALAERLALPATTARQLEACLGEGPYTAWGPFRLVRVMARSGLVVDERMRVLGRGAGSVPRLYAAGGVAYLDPVAGHGYPLIWALTSAEAAVGAIAG